MNRPAPISFVCRGLPGLLLVFFGLALAIAFRQRSAWSPEVKQLTYPLALVLAVGGGNLLSTYVRQRPLRKSELWATAVLVAVLVLGNWAR
ncbi:hypothetical protein ACFQ48_06935 [Hymenobacter caeli]|uniref:Transmembrane protein n=1 Tax=Hymenobacter caeli TaxID=2735894 RepID=A0ABX2FRB3_9BACT|nr:hypothetical protein [Hymenobacter caeli]NRT18919.1 hypothetical protein [Hymenobacter caeli]